MRPRKRAALKEDDTLDALNDELERLKASIAARSTCVRCPLTALQ